MCACYSSSSDLSAKAITLKNLGVILLLKLSPLIPDSQSKSISIRIIIIIMAAVNVISRMAFQRLRCPLMRSSSASWRPFSAEAATEKIPLPSETKTYAPKIEKLVDEIAQLNLLEVADLNSLLKSRLNISDAPVMMGGMVGGMGVAPPSVEEEEEATVPVAVQTSFTVTLNKFDAAKKVALIKELKNQLEDMNLVQAKKFVESAPAVVKADISKDEAEELKKALEAVGAECEVE